MPADDVRDLYQALLDRWNQRDGQGYAELFVEDGSIVGFDGSTVTSAASIAGHLTGIFAGHETATCVGKVERVRQITPGCVVLLAVAGLVPPGGSDLMPNRNTVQSLVAVETPEGWRIAHFQNTPASFDGRPEEAEALSAELRSVLAGG
jgi:uncharacterized protein (TIGR02246 family)